MSFQVQSCTIVILEQGFLPSRLNEDYLQLKKIVPPEWNWKSAAPPVTSPAFSAIAYEDGVALFAQGDRIQIGQAREGLDPLSSKVPEIARQLIRDNLAVEYTNIGLNFSGAYQVPDGSKFLINKFAIPRETIKNLELGKLEAMSFSSELNGSKVFFNFRNSIHQITGTSAILIDMNREYQVSGAASGKKALDVLGEFGDSWQFYSRIIKAVLAE